MPGQMPETLTLAQCQSIASYLHTAQDRFREFADTAREINPGLAQQFDKQQEEAKEFATLFENAEFAEVVINEE